MISGHWVFGIGLFAGILVPLFGQPSFTEFQQGLTAGSSPTAITLGPDGACWFIEQQAQQIGRITPAGAISEYPVPRAGAGLNGIATGPDGALWFTEGAADRIGRINTDGVITNEFALAAGSAPFGIVNGPDGALWFTEPGTGKIGRITSAGSVQEFPLPWTGSQLSEITLGPRGSLWFTDGSGNIGQVSASGAFTRYPIPTVAGLPRSITPGPDNALWFTETLAGKIGRITVGGGGGVEIGVPPGGVITEYPIPSGGQRRAIAFGPDGAMWFTEALGKLGRITLAGAVTEYDLPAGTRPSGIVVGPDGALWFTDAAGQIVRALPSGVPLLTEFPAPFQAYTAAITPGPDGALWFTADVNTMIGRADTAGAVITAYQKSSTPYGIVAGPDGAMWFTDKYKHEVGKIAGGVQTEYSVPMGTPYSITAGPDAALWFADVSSGTIGRITTGGALTVFEVPNAGSIPGIAVGPDGALWFTIIGAPGTNNGSIGRMTTSGAVTEYPIPTAGAGPESITVGPDGALWFTESLTTKVGRITTSGAITEFPVTTSVGDEFSGITAGPDGALWFLDDNNLVRRITTSGQITAYPVPGVAPGTSGITLGPDGALWFAEGIRTSIGRLVPPASGPLVITRFFATNPPGLPVTVDGVNYTTPQSFTWPVGSRHAIGTVTPPAASGGRYSFSGWSDGQAQAHTITTGPGRSVYVANFVVQYQLTMAVSPEAAGSIVAVPGSPDGYYDAGTPVQLTAQAYAGFQFAGWTGDAAGGGNPVSILMNTPQSAAAVFTGGSCAVTLTAWGASMGAAGGTGTVGLITDPACSWVVASAAPWVTIVGTISGAGSGTVTYSVAGNSNGTGRTAVLSVGGQSFTVTQGLHAVGVTPAAGTGQGAGFTFQFSDPDGYDKIGIVNVLINGALDARKACYLAYSQPLHVLYLTNDQGVATGPGVPLTGEANAANSQCLLVGGSAVATGTTLTLTLDLFFLGPFAGAKVVYLAVQDQSGNSSGWQPLGTWNVPGGSVAGPAVSGVTPVRTNTTGQTYTFTFTDSNGAQDLGVVNILIDAFLQGYGACYLAYSQPLNVLYLVDDTGKSLSTGLALNGAGSVSNSQCRVYSTGSSAVLSGDTLILTLNLAFLPGFSGDHVIYMAAGSVSSSQNSGWQPAGTVTAP